MADDVDAIYVAFSDDGAHIRKWSREPFEEGQAYLASTKPDPGVDERDRTIATLRRALAWHGDWTRMATTRADWQQEVDEALRWVVENPEEDRPPRPWLAATDVRPNKLPAGDNPNGSDEAKSKRFRRPIIETLLPAELEGVVERLRSVADEKTMQDWRRQIGVTPIQAASLLSAIEGGRR